MSAVLTKRPNKSKRYTPNDLLKMRDGDRYELVKGKLVERGMGAEAAYLAGEIYQALKNHVDEHKLGWVFPDGTSYQCYRDPKTARRPDVSFIKKGRLPGGRIPKGHIKVVPDLAVEVISPFDTAGELDDKVEEYFEVKVPLIWVVHPQMKLVRVHRLNGGDALLRGEAVLTGDKIVSGFTLPLEQLFAKLKE